MSRESDAQEAADRFAELNPEVRKFLAGLNETDLEYLRASIKFARDRETAGRFMKWLMVIFAFVTAGIVAVEKAGSIFFTRSP